MNKEDLEVFAREAAKTLKTEQDLNDFRAMLTKRIGVKELGSVSNSYPFRCDLSSCIRNAYKFYQLII